MGEMEKLTRTLVIGDKAFSARAMLVTATAQEIETALSVYRKGLTVYNNSNTSSGELYWGGSDVTQHNGFPIPKGAMLTIPVSTDLPVYVVAEAGETGDLRIMELA